MNAVPQTREGRGLGLLAAHCRSLDPQALSAQERVVEALGPELASKLMVALCTAGRRERRHAA
jgi:hypothetical protein